jgi:hypothetical protein
MRHLLLASAALALAACAPASDGIEVTRTASITANVAAVDPATREIDLIASDGSAFSFVAGPEMRNFDQIEPGDTATLEVSGTVTVRALGSRVGPEPETFAVLGRAPEGARPGAFAGTVSTMTVTLLGYDPATFEATILMPDGEELVVPVEPEMREYAAGRTAGERFELTFSDAVAAFVEPAA